MPPDPVALFELPSYVYDSRTGRYHGPLPSYRLVSHQTIMGLVQQRIDYHANEITRLTNALVGERITLELWERGMAAELKSLYLQQTALAKGGWQNVTPADKRRVTMLLREQFTYLDRFANDIAAGRLSAAQILWRAGLYPLAGRQSYWKARDDAMRKQGLTQERRIAIGDAGTCSPCTDLAAKGWRRIGTLPAPGGPPCSGINLCRCEKEYR